MVQFTDAAGIVPHLAREEAERRHQYHLGPEHLLLGLLVENDNPAARELRAAGVHLDVDNPVARGLRAHGLNSETVRAGIDRLIAEGVLPDPSPATPDSWPLSASTWTRSTPASRRPSAGRPTTPHGPSPVRLLVESQGLTLDQLRTAVLEELDQDR